MNLMNLMIMFIMMISSFIVMTFYQKNMYSSKKNFTFWMWIWTKNSARVPFSFQFFLIEAIFLIFDVEIALLLPTSMIMKVSNLMSWMRISFIFLLILLIGLYYEWNVGALESAN